MVNRLYNKQVSPKGFKEGGGADTGKLGELKSKLGVGQIKLAKAQEDLRKIKRLKKKLGIDKFKGSVSENEMKFIKKVMPK
jgi:hypothetical protein